ncbi:MAG: isoprenylcysteine carboxylmethyltransferase family protein [Kofleriaceae bacterium]
MSLSSGDAAHVRFPPPLVFIVVIGVGVVVEIIGPLRETLSPLLRWPLAAVFAASAIWLLTGALGWFRRTGQNPAPWTTTPSLVLSGPYRFTRNPMYLGMTLLQIAIGVAASVLGIVVLAFAALAVVHVVAVIPEETYLAQKFGEDYDRYRERVRRYL